jgi:hypothetical protein
MDLVPEASRAAGGDAVHNHLARPARRPVMSADSAGAGPTACAVGERVRWHVVWQCLVQNGDPLVGCHAWGRQAAEPGRSHADQDYRGNAEESAADEGSAT